jgi:hypothetical protein
VVARDLDGVTPPSDKGAVTAIDGPPSPMNARRREAVPYTAFCMFLQRWRILSFELLPEKLLASASPMFAVACQKCMGGTSLAATMTWSGFAAAAKVQNDKEV